MAGMAGGMLGQAYIRVRMDQSLIGEGLSAIKDTVLGTFQEIAGVAGGILAAAGIQSMTSSLAGLAGQFISTNDQLQRYQTSLEVLLGSAKNAKMMIADIEKMAAKTPFRMDDLTQAVVQLKIFGFEAEELIPTIRVIGDAAALSPEGMATGVQRISYALGEIRANGRIFGSEVRQLASAGVPVWDILSKKVGLTVSELRKMGSLGKLDSATYLPMLLEGMTERFGGGMEKQSKQWTGLLSTLEDESGFAMRRIGKPFFDAAWGRLKEIVAWLDSGGAKAFEARLTKIVGWVSEIANSKVDSAIKWLQGDAAAGFAGQLQDAAKWLYEISMVSFENIWAFLSGETVRTFARDIGNIAIELGKVAGISLVNVTAWLASSSGSEWLQWFRDLAGTIIQLASDFAALAVGYVVFTRVQGAAAALFATLQAGGVAMMLNPVTLLVAALGLLAAAFIASRVEGESFGDYVSMLIGRLMALGGAADDAVSRLKAAEAREGELADAVGTAEEGTQGEVSDEKIRQMDRGIADLSKQESEVNVRIRKAEEKLAGFKHKAGGGATWWEKLSDGGADDNWAGNIKVTEDEIKAAKAERSGISFSRKRMEGERGSRVSELGQKKSNEAAQAKMYGDMSGGMLGAASMLGNMDTILTTAKRKADEKAEKEKADKDKKADEYKKHRGNNPMGGLFGLGHMVDKDEKGGLSLKKEYKKKADDDQGFQTQNFDLAGLHKNIQAGIGKKTKDDEIAANTKETAGGMKKLVQMLGKKETKPKSTPRAG